MELTRNVLIVDDAELEQVIRQYNSIFIALKKEYSLNYDLNFIHVKLFDEAISKLKSDEDIFDVLLIDYDIKSAGNTQTGDELVKVIRETVNKHCKIIFYTMGDLSRIFADRNELISLFNHGLFRFLSKDLSTKNPKAFGPGPLQLRVESIIEAIDNIDFIQLTLERYFAEYGEFIKDERISVEGNDYSIKDLINLIRRDDNVGRIYKNNLSESIILYSLLAGEKN